MSDNNENKNAHSDDQQPDQKAGQQTEQKAEQKNDHNNEHANDELTGKKIFFVHPSAFLKNVVLDELVQQEYEIYVVKDEQKLIRVLKKNPDSIVFASIDEALPAPKWETFIRQIMGDNVTKTVSIGILSNAENPEVRKLYVDSLKVACGYIPVKMDKARVTQELLEILKNSNAKGRRKYIRANTQGETMTTINLPVNGEFVTGEIRDISVVGLACTFPQDPELAKNSIFHDIQIKLQGVLVKAEGIVFGFRMDGVDKVYVFLFTAKLEPAMRAKIRTHIQKSLQLKMDEEMK
jgi:hypothetical protein